MLSAPGQALCSLCPCHDCCPSLDCCPYQLFVWQTAHHLYQYPAAFCKDCGKHSHACQHLKPKRHLKVL